MPQEEEQGKLPFPPQYVTKSNALCRAQWSPESILEPRLVALLASKIDADDEDFKKYDIHVSELLGTGYGGDNARQLRLAAERVVGRTITVREGKSWSVYGVFSCCKYNHDTGIIAVGFHPDLKPHYLQLKKNLVQYTKYDLLEFRALPSLYSQRIFELLKSWKDQPEFSVPINELHKVLNAPISYRKNFKEFRIRVLEKARKDIHKHTSLRFAWKVIKSGRRVEAIQFIFSNRRVGEQQIEAVREKEGKALANAKKRTAAFQEAASCAIKKEGVCINRDRAKRVCAICDDMKFLAEIISKNG